MQTIELAQISQNVKSAQFIVIDKKVYDLYKELKQSIEGKTVYFVEDPRKLVDLLPEIKPAVLIGVPRFYEKIYERVLDNDQRVTPVE